MSRRKIYIHVQHNPILVGRVTQLLLLDSFDKRDAPPVQIVTPKLVIVIILLIFPYLTGKGDSWKHIFPIRDNLSGNNGPALLIRKCWKHWKAAKIEIISSVKIELSTIHPSMKQPSVTTIKEFPLRDNLLKSFKNWRYVTEYSPQDLIIKVKC